MYPLTAHFKKLRQNTLPPKIRLDAAKEFPSKVREFLKEFDSFETNWPHSRLVGSYAQKLCVGDVKDVDFLIFVDGSYEGEEMIEPKVMIGSLQKALKGLAEYLGYEDEEITIEAARRSVHVYFKNEEFHLDVVPCIAPNGIEEPVYVPCRNLEKWVETHPLGYIKLLNEVNAAHGYNVKRLGRILKHFVLYNMKQKNMRPKSYWLGALLIQIIEEKGFDDTMTQGELFHWVVSAIHEKYQVTLHTSKTATPNIKDPVLGHNISWNYGRNAFEQFMARLKEAKDWSARALADDTSKDEAIKLWQKVFGEDYFPTSVDSEVKQMAKESEPGRGYVEPNGRVVTAASASVAAVAAPITRFHGGHPTNFRVLPQGLSSAVQSVAVRRSFPGFAASFQKTTVTWKGELQPQAGSPVYKVSIRYRGGALPEIKVLRPQIRPDAPHLYSGGLLCLYWPKDRNWNHRKLVAETLIPWVAQWLLFYEIWLDTGEWLGPESPHRYPGKLGGRD